MTVKDKLETGRPDGDHDLDSGTGDNPGQKTGTQDDGRSFSQEDLDKILSDRLARARKSWQEELEKQKEEERQRIKAEQLAEQGKWKDLAAESTAKLDSLQPKVQQYETIIKDVLASQKTGLPDGVLELLESQDPADQLSWLTKYKNNLRVNEPGDDDPPKKPKLSKFNPNVPDNTGQPLKGLSDKEVLDEIRQNRGKGFWTPQ